MCESNSMKNQIMYVYFELGMNHGFDSVSMDQIAKEMSISKKTIYQYYRNKEAILEACIDYKFKEIDRKIHPILTDENKDALQKLDQITSSVAESLKVISNMQTSSLQRSFPSLWNKINEERKKRIKGYENLLREGIESGVLKPINPAVVIELYNSALLTATSTPFLYRYDLTWSQSVELVKQIIFDGIKNHKSLDL
jgi:AcrR family transcriptional regulator